MADKEILEKYGFKEQEEVEAFKDQYLKTEFPKPKKRYHLVWESPNISMEEAYYWILNYVRWDWGYPHVDKTEDVFTAAENSAFFGVSQQRLGLQQDKVSQFLATIGKMVKELFQIVRELRILDERRDYYEDSYSKDRRKAEAAEITLKGIWIDMVEQGAKNPSSVYGMSRELQFTTLPDLFFKTHPRTSKDVDPLVDRLEKDFNRKVREVLKRKLYSFLKWKEKTYEEMRNRRTFTVKYLRQHYDIIVMYMQWVRPYLRNIKRLHMDIDQALGPDLVSAFEGSLIEVEFIAYKLPYEQKSGTRSEKYYSVILAHFFFRTRPSMSYQQEGYQRGPIHVGMLDMQLRGYVWTKEQIENYKKMKKEMDLELIKSVSESVRAAYEALGEELQRYLEEAGEKFPEKSKKKEDFKKEYTKPSLFGMFAKSPKKKAAMNKDDDDEEKSFVGSQLKGDLWETYKNFKKAHKMLSW